MLAIIDYKVGNLGSIQNMLKKMNVENIITNDPKEIVGADKLILPGVGSFDSGMNKINELGLTDVLNDMVLVKKVPILGICLGMQLFSNKSQEGVQNGLGWINSTVLRFSSDLNQKIPHMGWNRIKMKKSSKLIDVAEDQRFYFVHSYYIKCDHDADILATCFYGVDFTCAVEKENIIGVQFHPEKSHKFGMQLLRNFVEKY